MPNFEVLSGSLIIGHSELELGDPPMGVAFGKFLPLSAYAKVKEAVVAALETYQDHLYLSVRLVGGETLPAQSVHLSDFSAELAPDEIEVSVIGISYPLYGELFPSHVAAYEAQ